MALTEVLKQEVGIIERRITEVETSIEKLALLVETKIDTKWFIATTLIVAGLVLGMFYYLVSRQDRQFDLLSSQIHEVSVTLGKTNESVASATTAIVSIDSFLNKFAWTTK